MMKLLVTILVVVGFKGCSSNPVSRDDSLDNYIRAVLETLKASMPTGIPELGIPILDPFDVPHFDIPHIS